MVLYSAIASSVLARIACVEVSVRGHRFRWWRALDALHAAIDALIIFMPAGLLAYSAWWLTVGVKSVGYLVLNIPNDHPQWRELAEYAGRYTNAVVVGTTAAMAGLMADLLRIVYQVAKERWDER